jgi:hypothetical protein
VDLNGSEQNLMAGFREYGNKVMGLIKADCLDHRNNWKPFEKTFAMEFVKCLHPFGPHVLITKPRQ